MTNIGLHTQLQPHPEARAHTPEQSPCQPSRHQQMDRGSIQPRFQWRYRPGFQRANFVSSSLCSFVLHPAVRHGVQMSSWLSARVFVLMTNMYFSVPTSVPVGTP
ncbi:unnamed protein product [Lepeophtheirus salmonis]|uniref:(salmon louse) hypothetical protein n=1 Tax=Lepeophtheirus salmonis TaxID=72036 RepID=A0A7R8CFU0_LEPSM|nr:unnamed protein product [Lepeophtheirus salmonis]CAF2804300.1 unnamed protein product [Lepeophtheirus salmonis]